MRNMVAWPWLGVRRWGAGSKRLPCHDVACWLPGEISGHTALATNSSALWAGRKRGWLSRGHRVFALLASLSCPCSPCIPISVPMATAGQEAAAAIPVPAARKLDRRLVLRDWSIFARVVFHHFTERKWCVSYRQEK